MNNLYTVVKSFDVLTTMLQEEVTIELKKKEKSVKLSNDNHENKDYYFLGEIKIKSYNCPNNNHKFDNIIRRWKEIDNIKDLQLKRESKTHESPCTFDFIIKAPIDVNLYSKPESKKLVEDLISLFNNIGYHNIENNRYDDEKFDHQYRMKFNSEKAMDTIKRMDVKSVINGWVKHNNINIKKLNITIDFNITGFSLSVRFNKGANEYNYMIEQINNS